MTNVDFAIVENTFIDDSINIVNKHNAGFIPTTNEVRNLCFINILRHMKDVYSPKTMSKQQVDGVIGLYNHLIVL